MQLQKTSSESEPLSTGHHPGVLGVGPRASPTPDGVSKTSVRAPLPRSLVWHAVMFGLEIRGRWPRLIAVWANIIPIPRKTRPVIGRVSCEEEITRSSVLSAT